MTTMIKVKDSIISIIGVMVSQGNFFLCIWLIGHNSGAEVLGHFNYFLSIGILIGTLCIFRYELSCISDNVKVASNSLINVLILTVFFGMLWYIFLFFTDKSLLIIIIFSLAYIILQSFYYFFNSLRRYLLIGIFKSVINFLFLLLILLVTFLYSENIDYFLLYTLCYCFIIIVSFIIIISNLQIKGNPLNFCNFLKENYRFPLYIFPSTCCSSILLYSLSIVIPTFYSLELAGYFALSYRLGSFPVSLIAQSISGVFRRDMISAKAEDNFSLPKKIYFSYVKMLGIFIIMYLVFGLLLFQFIIEFLFGPEWNNSVIYFYLMIPLFVVQLMYIPLSQVFLVYKKQAVDLILNASMAVSLLFLFGVSYYFDFLLTHLILSFSIISCFILLIGLFITYNIVNENDCNTD